MNSVTQKDIAARLGVSVALVSRALSGKGGDIGARRETIRKIEKVARELNYVPNASARSLKGMPSKTLGVVVLDFEDSFLAMIIGSLHRKLHQLGYSMVLTGFAHRDPRAEDLRALPKHQVDGFLIVGGDSPAAWIRPFLRRAEPIAQIGTGRRIKGVFQVSVDEIAGASLLMAHLHSLGARKIGLVSDELAPHEQRFKLLRRMALSYGFKVKPQWIGISSQSGGESGYIATRSLLQRSGRDCPDAIVAASDILALGVLRALHQAGLKVPGDIRVVGFDDIPASVLATPSLTTVRQPVARMVEAALAHLTKSDGDSNNGGSIKLVPELVIRESSGRPETERRKKAI